MIILGIDPGSRSTGFGVIEIFERQERVIGYDVFAVDSVDDHSLRLKRIYDRVISLIDELHPDECAVEMPVYGRNAQSMLKLGRAQAAAILACMNREIPTTQYTPKEVKKSVTGNGNASKEQVWYMVRSLLDLQEDRGFDAADALAVSLCHAHRMGGENTQRFKNWKSFVAANPGRTK